MSLSTIALAETFYSRRCSRMQTPPGLKWLPAFSSHFSASSPLLLLSINDLLHTYYAAIRRPNLTRQVYTHAAPGPCCPLSLPCIATKEQRGRSSAPDSTVTPTQVQIHFIISWESGAVSIIVSLVYSLLLACLLLSCCACGAFRRPSQIVAMARGSGLLANVFPIPRGTSSSPHSFSDPFGT